MRTRYWIAGGAVFLAGYLTGKAVVLLPWTQGEWWSHYFAPDAIGATLAFGFSIVYLVLSRKLERRDLRQVLLRRLKWEIAANRDYFAGMIRIVWWNAANASTTAPQIFRYIPSGLSDKAFDAFWSSQEARALRRSRFSELAFQAYSAVPVFVRMEAVIVKLVYDIAVGQLAHEADLARQEAFAMLSGRIGELWKLRTWMDFLFDAIDDDGNVWIG